MIALVGALLATSVPTSSTAEGAETVVVTGRSTEGSQDAPYSTQRLDTEEIDLGRPTLGLGESLSQVPGVYVSSRFNFAQDSRISIRGFGARSAFGIRGIRIVLDGIPLTLPDGQSQIDSIDLANVGRIEVLRGPAGSLYGNASGGVLILESKEAPAGTTVDIRNALGAYGLWKLSGTGQVGLNKTDVSVFASRTQWDGYREQSNMEQIVAQGRIVTELAPTVRLSGTVHYVNAPTADDPGGLTREQVEADRRQAAPTNVRFRTGEALSQLQAGARLVADLSADHRLEWVAHAGLRDFANRIPFRIVEFGRDFYGGLGIYRWRASVGQVENRLNAGVEVQGQRDRRRNEGSDDGLPNGEVELNQTEEALSLGLFLQDRLELLPNLNLLGSIRYDRIEFSLDDRLGSTSGSRVMDQVTGQGGLSWGPWSWLTLFGNVSQSFETPTLSELTTAPGSPMGLRQDLDPQRALSFEVGARSGSRRHSVEASAFWIELNDELVPREGPDSRVYFVNAAESRRIGAEFFGRLELISGLELRAGYTWLLAEFRDAARLGNRTPGIPENRLFGRLRWWKGPLHATAELEWVDRIFVDDANSQATDAYARGEVRAGILFPLAGAFSGEFTVGVRNVYDVEYIDNVRINAFGGRYFEPAPVLHAYGVLNLRYRNPG